MIADLACLSSALSWFRSAMTCSRFAFISALDDAVSIAPRSRSDSLSWFWKMNSEGRRAECGEGVLLGQECMMQRERIIYESDPMSTTKDVPDNAVVQLCFDTRSKSDEAANSDKEIFTFLGPFMLNRR